MAHSSWLWPGDEGGGGSGLITIYRPKAQPRVCSEPPHSLQTAASGPGTLRVLKSKRRPRRQPQSTSFWGVHASFSCTGRKTVTLGYFVNSHITSKIFKHFHHHTPQKLIQDYSVQTKRTTSNSLKTKLQRHMEASRRNKEWPLE